MMFLLDSVALKNYDIKSVHLMLHIKKIRKKTITCIHVYVHMQTFLAIKDEICMTITALISVTGPVLIFITTSFCYPFCFPFALSK